MGRHANLVSIHSDHEQAFILTIMEFFKSVPQAWIGLSDSKSERNFLWSDEKPFDYSNWNFNEPNGAWWEGQSDVS